MYGYWVATGLTRLFICENTISILSDNSHNLQKHAQSYVAIHTLNNFASPHQIGVSMAIAPFLGTLCWHELRHFCQRFEDYVIMLCKRHEAPHRSVSHNSRWFFGGLPKILTSSAFLTNLVQMLEAFSEFSELSAALQKFSPNQLHSGRSIRL